jgi:hypothetical protein
MTSTRRLFLSLPLFLLAVSLSGCSGGKTPAKVSGKITYKNDPVTAGTITFHQKDGGIFTYAIQADGTYSGSDMPAEEMVVTIETESVNPDAKRPGAGKMPGSGGRDPMGDYNAKMKERGAVQEPTKPAGKYVKIPAKYNDEKQSGLKLTLTKGKTEKNWDLD